MAMGPKCQYGIRYDYRKESSRGTFLGIDLMHLIQFIVNTYYLLVSIFKK